MSVPLCVSRDFEFPGSEREKNTQTDRFHGNGPYCKIPTNNWPIRTPNLAEELPAIYMQ